MLNKHCGLLVSLNFGWLNLCLLLSFVFFQTLFRLIARKFRVWGALWQNCCTLGTALRCRLSNRLGSMLDLGLLGSVSAGSHNLSTASLDIVFVLTPGDIADLVLRSNQSGSVVRICWRRVAGLLPVIGRKLILVL
jgi:hypothetical protein